MADNDDAAGESPRTSGSPGLDAGRLEAAVRAYDAAICDGDARGWERVPEICKTLSREWMTAAIRAWEATAPAPVGEAQASSDAEIALDLATSLRESANTAHGQGHRMVGELLTSQAAWLEEIADRAAIYRAAIATVGEGAGLRDAAITWAAMHDHHHRWVETGEGEPDWDGYRNADRALLAAIAALRATAPQVIQANGPSADMRGAGTGAYAWRPPLAWIDGPGEIGGNGGGRANGWGQEVTTSEPKGSEMTNDTQPTFQTPAEVVERGEIDGIGYAIVLVPRFGHHCAYVRLPSGHPWEDQSDECAIDVHGGITYSKQFGDGCWLGWDYGHAGDDEMGWDVDTVREHVRDAVRQVIEAMGKGEAT